MLGVLVNLFGHLPQKMRHPLERKWYEHMSSLHLDADVLLVNYGWASLDPTASALTLRPEDEPNRYCTQLYHCVASVVDLCGLDVLEVGCGRGRGASYVMRYLWLARAGQERSLTSKPSR